MPARLTSRIPAVMRSGSVGTAAAVESVARDIATEARVRVPDRPPIGEGLIETIGHRQLSPFEAHAFASAFYAAMVELGTRHSAPHPYMVPAAESVRAALRQRVGVAWRSGRG